MKWKKKIKFKIKGIGIDCFFVRFRPIGPNKRNKIKHTSWSPILMLKIKLNSSSSILGHVWNVFLFYDPLINV